jgi:biopolymer transport protein ExbD
MREGLRSDINVTPLVDIVLVLLIVFIVLVPALPRALATVLPQGGGAAGPAPVRLTLAADGALDLDGVPVTLAELPGRLPTAAGKVVLRIHPSLPFQRATTALDVVKGARPRASVALVALPEHT